MEIMKLLNGYFTPGAADSIYQEAAVCRSSDAQLERRMRAWRVSIYYAAWRSPRCR